MPTYPVQESLKRIRARIARVKKGPERYNPYKKIQDLRERIKQKRERLTSDPETMRIHKKWQAKRKAKDLARTKEAVSKLNKGFMP